MYHVGKTVGVQVSDMKDAKGVTLVSPTVTMSATHKSGEVIEITPANIGGGVWYGEFEPELSGAYVIRIEAVSTNTFIDEYEIFVHR